jgi:flagellar protein FlaG
MMNIKGVNFDPAENVSRLYKRPDTAGADQRSPAQPQTQNMPHEYGKEEMSDLIEKLNKGVQEIHERLSFSFHEKTKRIIVKIVNSDTNEVIREIPPKDAIKLLEHIQDFLGLLVDESR